MFPIYTIQKHEQYDNVLFINGKESICQFKPAVAVPVQNALGNMTMQVINFPCCTSCPHAHIEKLGLNDNTTFNIACTGGTVKELEILEDNTDNNIIQMI
jgi:hypothetical protein